MANSWIEHVKRYAREHNLKYPDALKKAKSSYTKSTTTKSHKKHHRKH